MEIENHKEEVPFEHYLDKFHTLDPKEAAQRLNILYDESAKKFQLRFLGHLYEVEYPDFHVTVLDKPQEDMEKDLLMTSLPAQTFIMRYLLEGQYIASSGKFMIPQCLSSGILRLSRTGRHRPTGICFPTLQSTVSNRPSRFRPCRPR